MPRRLAIAGILAVLLGGCAELREKLDYYDAELQRFAGVDRVRAAVPHPAPAKPDKARRALGRAIPAPGPKPASPSVDEAGPPGDVAGLHLSAPPAPPEPAETAPGPSAPTETVFSDPPDPVATAAVQDLDWLIGSGADDVASALGEPAARRSQGAAEVWAYETNECVLEVYMYPEITGGVLHALAWRHSGRNCR